METELPEDDQEGNEQALAVQMYAAVKAQDVSKVRILLHRRVPPDVWGITENDDLPLQSIAWMKGEGALKIANALISAGAEIDYQNGNGCTALARAVVGGGLNGDHWEMARLLIHKGANASLFNNDGLNPAESASSDMDDDAVLVMLEAGMTPNLRGISGPLIWFVAYNSPRIVKALLARGVDPNAKAYGTGFRGQTPLQRAVDSYAEGGVSEGDFCEIAIALIEAGADPAQLDQVPDYLAAYLLARKERVKLSMLPPGTVDPEPHGPI